MWLPCSKDQSHRRWTCFWWGWYYENVNYDGELDEEPANSYWANHNNLTTEDLNKNTLPRWSGTCEALYVDSQVVCQMSVAQKKSRWVTMVAKIATHLHFLPKLPLFATTLPKTRCLGPRLCHQSNRPLGSSLLSKAPLPNHLHHRQARTNKNQDLCQPQQLKMFLLWSCACQPKQSNLKMFLLWSCARRLVSLVSSERLQCHVWGRNPVQNQVTIPPSGQSVLYYIY